MMPTLSLLRLQPDLHRLATWAASTRQKALQADLGYALHAATRATLGVFAPRPFCVRARDGVDELVGYVAAHADDILRAASLPTQDLAAAAAIGLETMSAKTMPRDWRAGERLSFEVRATPLVRSRNVRQGAVVEVDAAYHDSLAGDTPGDREGAYGPWLQRELARGGAAALQGWRLHAFKLTPVARRSQADAGRHGRELARGQLPDLTARGELIVGDGPAFAALLARGLGRHRAFGYGCLLLAPAGVLHSGQ